MKEFQEKPLALARSHFMRLQQPSAVETWNPKGEFPSDHSWGPQPVVPVVTLAQELKAISKTRELWGTHRAHQKCKFMRI